MFHLDLKLISELVFLRNIALKPNLRWHRGDTKNIFLLRAHAVGIACARSSLLREHAEVIACARSSYCVHTQWVLREHAVAFACARRCARSSYCVRTQ